LSLPVKTKNRGKPNNIDERSWEKQKFDSFCMKI
jgi:hypothetical protein